MKLSSASPPHLITLILLAALATLSLNLFLPSLANIAADFQADYAVVNLSIAGYLAVTAVLQLVIGPLSDRYGRRPILLIAVALFVAASLGCALSQDVWSFLAFRILQGAIISGWVLSLAVIRDTVPAQQAASLMGYLSMAMAVAPMLGPMLGGVLDALFGWRASFYAFTGFGVALLVLTWLDLGETNTSKAATFGEQLHSYPALLGSGRFWGYALCMAFSTAAFYAFLSGVPLVARGTLNLPPEQLGFYMGSITGGFFLGSFLSGRYAKRFALTTTILCGRILACLGPSLGLIFVFSGLINELTIFGATLCVGMGNGLTIPSANAGALSVRPELTGSASGLAGALMVGIGALVATVTGLIVTEGNAAPALLALMLACSTFALLSLLWVRALEARTRS
ncbi:MAG: multidrug effflux MFS transporter [Rhodovibrionaceae bacterium]